MIALATWLRPGTTAGRIALVLAVPALLLVVVLLEIAGGALRRVWRRRRGLCPTCGSVTVTRTWPRPHGPALVVERCAEDPCPWWRLLA